MKPRRVVAALVVLALAVAGVWWLAQRSQEERGVAPGGSGIIEITEVQVGTPHPGRVIALRVREGSAVKRGQILAVMDLRVLRDQVRAARALVQAARASVDAALEDDDEAAEKIARAQVRQAQAQAAIAEAQLDDATIRCPVDGVVLDTALRRGEIASAGQTVLTVGDVSRPRLVVYVPEPLVGRVKLGAGATVAVDAFPSRSFDATVSAVAEQAEFTPTTVQTKEQRTKLVYAVTLRLLDPKRELKPGMPADAVIHE